MNTTFWTWLGVAGALGLALLFILGGDGAPEPAAPSASTASVGEENAYWEPVTTGSASTGRAPVSSSCTGCEIVRVPLAAVVPVVERTEGLAGGCADPYRGACAPSPCPPAPQTCNRPLGALCGREGPGINRNQVFCVDECSFIQLHSTVPHPLSVCYRFEWTASRGSFLDPRASDPIYYAPSASFPGGEEVWIVLAVTAPDGARYTDSVKLRVRDVR